jgi:outer membrane protein assembly factor BamA
VKAMPEINDGDATVSYQLAVLEGAVYHMGELVIDGLSPDATRKMELQWQLKKGDAYDESYLRRFFKTMYHDIGLSGSFNVIPKATVNSEDKTVAVALHFMPK